MKQLLIASIISLLFSYLSIQPSNDTLNILYGIIGVLFSVGMSLIIAFSSSNIKNSEIKKRIRKSIHIVRNNFLFTFLFCSVYYILYSIFEKKVYVISIRNVTLHINFAMSVLVFLVYSVMALVSNYIQIQQLYEDIEDQIEEESKR